MAYIPKMASQVVKHFLKDNPYGLQQQHLLAQHLHGLQPLQQLKETHEKG